MEIFPSKYADRWCLGIDLDEATALEVQLYLKVNCGLGNSQYQVLANKETKKYEKNFNLIINSYEKSELEKMIPGLEKLLEKLLEKNDKDIN